MTRPISEMRTRELSDHIKGLEAGLQRINQERRRKAEELGLAQAELTKRTKPLTAPKVSDHAILRFLERVHGVDTNAIRDKMLTPEVASAINAGACAVQVGGIKMMVKDKTITTVLE